MSTVLSLILFGGLILLFVRRLLSAPQALNRQGVRVLFLQQMRDFRPDLQLLDETADRVSMQIGAQVCTVQFEQLYRRCAEQSARMGEFIQQAIDGIATSLLDDTTMPTNWAERVYPLLMRADSTIPPALLTDRVTTQLSLGYVIRNEHTFSWMTKEMLQQTPVSEDALHTLAIRNLERSCSNLVIDTPGEQADGQEHYLRFITADGLDAARVLIPSLHSRFAPRFHDDDLLVAIPTRDTLVMIGSHDGAIANFLGYRGTWEHNRRAFPVSDRLLLVTENGISPWPPEQKLVENIPT